MEKSKQKRNQIILAWLLVVALMPMNMVKAFHHHQHTSCHDTTQHQHKHAHDNCQICQFVLSLFLEAESSELRLVTSYVACQQPTYSAESHTLTLDARYLRGPPTFVS